MYAPPEFEISDFAEIFAFLKENPLGALILNDAEGQHSISHLPFRLEQRNDFLYLHAHLSRANPQFQCISDGKNCTLIFMGPDAYISSSVYAHENVPTWNYQAVHIRGNISLMSQNELLNELDHLMNEHESKRPDPLQLQKINPDLIENYLKHICGISIRVNAVKAVYKLSQNRNQQDYHSIITDLEKQANPKAGQVAAVMKKRRP